MFSERLQPSFLLKMSHIRYPNRKKQVDLRDFCTSITHFPGCAIIQTMVLARFFQRWTCFRVAVRAYSLKNTYIIISRVLRDNNIFSLYFLENPKKRKFWFILANHVIVSKCIYVFLILFVLIKSVSCIPVAYFPNRATLSAIFIVLFSLSQVFRDALSSPHPLSNSLHPRSLQSFLTLVSFYNLRFETAPSLLTQRNKNENVFSRLWQYPYLYSNSFFRTFRYFFSPPCGPHFDCCFGKARYSKME